MPNIYKVYYCACYYNYYNNTIDIYIKSDNKTITPFNIIYKHTLSTITYINISHILTKYSGNTNQCIALSCAAKKNYYIILKTIWLVLNINNIPKDICNYIKQYIALTHSRESY